MIEDKFEKKTMYKSNGDAYKTLNCKVYEPIPLINKCGGYDTMLTKHIYGSILQTGKPHERYPIIKSGTYDRYSLTQTGNGYSGIKNGSVGYSSSKAA